LEYWSDVSAADRVWQLVPQVLLNQSKSPQINCTSRRKPVRKLIFESCRREGSYRAEDREQESEAGMRNVKNF
jgi:hypothetical protein